MQIYKTSKARENILSKIRKELSAKSLPLPFPEADNDNSPLYHPTDAGMEEQFATVFSSLGGKFIFCDNEQELLQNIAVVFDNYGWTKMLCADERLLKLFQNNRMDIVQAADPTIEDADACITGCEFLVARTGSMIFSSAQSFGRTSSVFYPVHLVFAFNNQMVADIDDALTAMKKKYRNELPSMISLTTGPSRTADIEKTLVVGVHGPCEIFCFFVNTES